MRDIYDFWLSTVVVIICIQKLMKSIIQNEVPLVVVLVSCDGS